MSEAHKVSNNAESEAPAVARWAALVGYAKRTVLRRRLKVSAVGRALYQEANHFRLWVEGSWRIFCQIQ